MASADRLIFACREDTAILTSVRAWFDDELQHIQEQCIKAPTYDEVLKLQGAAIALRKMRENFTQEVKSKMVEDEKRRPSRRFNVVGA